VIKSNLSQVIRRLEFYQSGLAPAVQRAIAPAAWSPLLVASARTVLQAAAAAEETEPGELARFVPDILDSFRASVTAVLTRYSLSFSGTSAGFGVSINAARDLMLGQALGKGEQGQFGNPQQNLQAARDLVERWVREEKTLDVHETEDQAVQSILQILGLTRRPDFQYTEPMERAAEKLVQKYIGPWAAEQQPEDHTALDPARARAWARLVLNTWRALAELELPRRLALQLDNLRRAAARL